MSCSLGHKKEPPPSMEGDERLENKKARCREESGNGVSSNDGFVSFKNKLLQN